MLLNKILAGGLVVVSVLALFFWWSLESQLKKNLDLENEVGSLSHQVSVLKTLAEENRIAAEEAFKSRERVESSLDLVTQDRNKLKKQYSYLNQQLREAIRDDPEVRNWDSTVVPGTVFGLLLQAGGVRAQGGDPEGVSPKVFDGGDPSSPN